MFDHPWLCIGNDNAQGTNKNKNILCDLLIKHYSLTEWNNKLHSIYFLTTYAKKGWICTLSRLKWLVRIEY